MKLFFYLGFCQKVPFFFQLVSVKLLTVRSIFTFSTLDKTIIIISQTNWNQHHPASYLWKLNKQLTISTKMNPWTILLKLFFCTIPFIPEMNDNSWDSFRKTDQNFKSFSETAQKLKLQNADYQCYFQKKNKKIM